MDNSEKQGSSEASSEDERSSKRSYECAFCKRGFTNAQALGGHMNIHRKDRAKAKQHLTVPNNNNSSNNKFQQQLLSPARPYVPSNISSGRPAMFLEAYHACFMAPVPSPYPSPSPRILHPQYGYYGSSTSGAAPLGASEELMGANLSLGLGPVAMESDNLMKRFMRKEDEVDLELRLGHFP